MPGISLTAVWFILFVMFVIAEVITAGSLVSIWFCFGAIVAMLASIAGASAMAQVIIFLLVSVVLLILTKPLAKKMINSRIEQTNAPALIGKFGIVKEEICNSMDKGAVKINGKIWTARTENDDEIISEGERVKIVEIRGVKLIVRTEE